MSQLAERICLRLPRMYHSQVVPINILWECRKRFIQKYEISKTTLLICLDKYILCRVYKERGICIRNYCGAEPSRDIEPPGLIPTVSWGDRASTSYATADRVKALARAARGRFCGIHRGRSATSLPAET